MRRRAEPGREVEIVGEEQRVKFFSEMPRSTGGTASGLLVPKAIVSTIANGSRKKVASQT